VAFCTGSLSDALLNDKNLEKATGLLSRNNYPRDTGYFDYGEMTV